MSLKLKPVSEQVIVITGASSGIGLATAQMAAKEGARVVLAARTEEALNMAVQEITAQGGQAVAVVADVGSREDMKRVADQAIQRFGRIDTWVNNAGVGIWGRIEEVSLEDMRRLFDTNFWGQVHGSLVALPHLKPNGGALINVGSMASDRAIPLQGIYSASKHAVKGFTDALRTEIEAEGAPVSVTLIKPASIGTPLPQHVKNYTAHEAKLPPPVYAPEEVGRAILRAAAHPVRDVTVGGAARAISTVSKFVPRVVDLVSEAMAPVQLGPKPSSPGDNLWQGRAEAEVHGDPQGSMIRPSLYTRAAAHPVLATAVGGAALASVSYLLRRRGTKSPQIDGSPDVNGDLATQAVTDASLSELDVTVVDIATLDELEGTAGLEAAPGRGLDETAGEEDSSDKEAISDGMNARPRSESISQSAGGIPDDSSEMVEVSPEDEARIADRIQSL
jgi:short-subunit dehydrogenase